MKIDSGGIAYLVIVACLIMFAKSHCKATTRVHSCVQFYNGSTPPESYVRICLRFLQICNPAGIGKYISYPFRYLFIRCLYRGKAAMHCGAATSILLYSFADDFCGATNVGFRRGD